MSCLVSRADQRNVNVLIVFKLVLLRIRGRQHVDNFRRVLYLRCNSTDHIIGLPLQGKSTTILILSDRFYLYLFGYILKGYKGE